MPGVKEAMEDCPAQENLLWLTVVTGCLGMILFLLLQLVLGCYRKRKSRQADGRRAQVRHTYIIHTHIVHTMYPWPTTSRLLLRHVFCLMGVCYSVPYKLINGVRCKPTKSNMNTSEVLCFKTLNMCMECMECMGSRWQRPPSSPPSSSSFSKTVWEASKQRATLLGTANPTHLL